MKKIEAIFRPEKLEEVKAALDENGFYGMTISDVHGRGAQKGISLQFRGRKIHVDMIPKVMIMMVIPDAQVEKAIEVIRISAYTGKIGDGKIFVSPVDMVAGVRSGDLVTE